MLVKAYIIYNAYYEVTKIQKKYNLQNICYTGSMHWIQEKLLQIASLNDIDELRLVDLVEMVGCEHPSQIKHHMSQLVEKQKLVRKKDRLVPALSMPQGLLTIPVLGEADCGEATKYVDGRIIDNLVVSPSLVTIKYPESVYALVAKGDSMNAAAVNGKTICDGDYVIVEKREAYTPKDNDIVVSDIGGLANIKRFRTDPANRRIILMPESMRDDYAPIIIDETDDYAVVGKVVEVVKSI